MGQFHANLSEFKRNGAKKQVILSFRRASSELRTRGRLRLCMLPVAARRRFKQKANKMVRAALSHNVA
jgi:hypothetical protein